MTAEPLPLESWMEESGALRRGHFLLSSGLHSPAYVQCALLLESPHRARRIGRALAEPMAEWEADSVLSPALGGLIIGYEVAAALDLPFRFVERVDGQMALRRGFRLEAGERVIVVEDVVTTGRSTREAMDVARRAGAEICAVASILDRTGGEDTFEIPYVRLLEIDLPTFNAEACPLCQMGEAFDQPGSRPLS